MDTSRLAQILGHTPEEQETSARGIDRASGGTDTLTNKTIGINALISTFEKVVLASTGYVFLFSFIR